MDKIKPESGVKLYDDEALWGEPKPFKRLNKYIILENGEWQQMSAYKLNRVARDSEGYPYIEIPIAVYDEKTNEGYIKYEPKRVILTGFKKFVAIKLSALIRKGGKPDRQDPKQLQLWDWPKGYIIEKAKERNAKVRSERLERQYKKTQLKKGK